jgi:hypothetical protein
LPVYIADRFSKECSKITGRERESIASALDGSSLAFDMELDTRANLDERHKQLYRRKIRIHGLAVLVLVGVISVARKAYRH